MKLKLNDIKKILYASTEIVRKLFTITQVSFLQKQKPGEFYKLIFIFHSKNVFLFYLFVYYQVGKQDGDRH